MRVSFAKRRSAILIPLFCVWHMVSVAAYVIPENWQGMGGRVVSPIRKLTSPYVLLFSQWQQWNIFSPDPLRTVRQARIERYAGDHFEVALILDRRHLFPWRSAKEIKILERISGNWRPLLPSYLASFCSMLRDTQGTTLQLVSEEWVLPSSQKELEHRMDATLSFSTRLLGSTRCL